MRFIFIFFISCIQLLVIAQVEPINCFHGEKEDYLTHYNLLSNRTHLLNIRSNSHSGDFISVIDSAFMNNKCNWIFGMSENGSILWKKQLPNTYFKFNIDFFNVYFSIIPINIDYYLTNIYTIQQNEILLHYDYMHPLNTQLPDSIGNQIYLDFGILLDNGNYKIVPYCIDSILVDSAIVVTEMRGLKLNDSIYQLAINYSKKTANYFGISSQPYSILYTININSEEITKHTLSGNYSIEMNKHDLFLVNLENNIKIFTQDATGNIKSYIYDNSFNFDASINIDLKENNVLYITTSLQDTVENIVFTKARIYKINLNDSTLLIHDYGDCNTLSCYYYLTGNYHYTGKYIFPYEYVSSNFSKPNYIFYTNSYDSTWHNHQQTQLVQVNENNLSIDKTFPFNSELFQSNVYELDNGGFMLFQAKNNADSLCNYHNKFSLIQIDSNFQMRAENNFDDTILYNGNSYILSNNYSPVFYYFKFLNYAEQFVVSLIYKNDVENLFIYYLVKYGDSSITQIILPDELMSTIFSEGALNQNINVFYTAGQSLYFYSNNYLGCDTSTNNLDVQLFKYLDPVSKTVMPVKNNTFFTFYPNPASSLLYLNFKDVQDDGNLTVFDINGKIVLEKSIKSQQEIIHTSDWVNGIYFMRYQTKDFLQTEKVLIQH